MRSCGTGTDFQTSPFGFYHERRRRWFFCTTQDGTWKTGKVSARATSWPCGVGWIWWEIGRPRSDAGMFMMFRDWNSNQPNKNCYLHYLHGKSLRDIESIWAVYPPVIRHSNVLQALVHGTCLGGWCGRTCLFHLQSWNWNTPVSDQKSLPMPDQIGLSLVMNSICRGLSNYWTHFDTFCPNDSDLLEVTIQWQMEEEVFRIGDVCTLRRIHLYIETWHSSILYRLYINIISPEL